MDDKTLSQHNWAEAISIISLKIIIYILAYGVYAGVYNIKLIQGILSIILVQGFFFKDKNTEEVKKFISILWGSTMIILLLTRPKLTYGEGKSKLVAAGYDNIENAVEKSNNSFDYEDKAVTRVYFYKGKKAKENYYLQVNPRDGKIRAKKPGEDKYIDSLYKKK